MKILPPESNKFLQQEEIEKIDQIKRKYNENKENIDQIEDFIVINDSKELVNEGNTLDFNEKSTLKKTENYVDQQKNNLIYQYLEEMFDKPKNSENLDETIVKNKASISKKQIIMEEFVENSQKNQINELENKNKENSNKSKELKDFSDFSQNDEISDNKEANHNKSGIQSNLDDWLINSLAPPEYTVITEKYVKNHTKEEEKNLFNINSGNSYKFELNRFYENRNLRYFLKNRKNDKKKSNEEENRGFV